MLDIFFGDLHNPPIKNQMVHPLEFALVIRPVCPGLFKPDALTLPPSLLLLQKKKKNSRRSLNQHHDSVDIKSLI